jgi:DNA-3-methyladenine glycosylase I
MSDIDLTLTRCAWVNPAKPHYVQYHDEEWGVPVHDDRKHFEMLTLEGAQAGLSWETILRRREGYRQAFHQFDPACVARMTDAQLTRQLQNPAIIRNRLKVFSVRQNARAFLAIQQQFGCFDEYVWQFVDGAPQINHWQTLAQVPAHTSVSDALAKDLKRRGMSFVGSTILYAYMQAIGMVNDHTSDCWCYPIP